MICKLATLQINVWYVKYFYILTSEENYQLIIYKKGLQHYSGMKVECCSKMTGMIQNGYYYTPDFQLLKKKSVIKNFIKSKWYVNK